jgi:hypothetical protein
VHKRIFLYHIAHPSTESKSLNLVLFDVQSDIHSENWSHYCSTRPIEPIEGAGLEEPRAGSPSQAPAAASSPQLGTAHRAAHSRVGTVVADFALATKCQPTAEHPPIWALSWEILRSQTVRLPRMSQSRPKCSSAQP